jgi:hypothetical protein
MLFEGNNNFSENLLLGLLLAIAGDRPEQRDLGPISCNSNQKHGSRFCLTMDYWFPDYAHQLN